jgi:uncharacterized protein YoaH (UPF0181 family)
LVGWATQGALSQIFERIVLLQVEGADRIERAFAQGISRNDACTLVASRMGQIEHEPISTRPMLTRDDALSSKSEAC